MPGWPATSTARTAAPGQGGRPTGTDWRDRMGAPAAMQADVTKWH
ncbi:hypothetical protein [Streptomyces sp. NPDC012888]